MKLKEEYTAEMLNRLEIFRKTPEETFEYLIASSASTPDDRLPFERFIVGRTARREGAEVVDIGMPVRPLRRY